MQFETYGNLESLKRVYFNQPDKFKDLLSEDFKYYEGVYDEEIGNLPLFILKNKVSGLIQMMPSNIIKYIFAKFICVKEVDGETNRHVIKSYWISNIKEDLRVLFDTEGFTFEQLNGDKFYEKFMETNDNFVCDEKLH